MKKTGNIFLLSILLLCATASWATTEITQTVSRNKVGTDDTFRLTVEVTDAPQGAELHLPSAPHFEVLSTAQSSQMSFQMGTQGASMKRTIRYTLTMRPNSVGTLTIPPSTVTVNHKTFESGSVTIEAVKGSLGSERGNRNPGNSPFGNFPGFPSFPDDDDASNGFPEPEIPHSDSDLFVRAAVDKSEVYEGQQVTLTLMIFSRVDLSSVDSVQMPKLEGFWTEDLETPNQLSAEQRMVGGVPYRAYLLRRRVLFPVKTGNLSIEPAEVDLSTGFVFSSRRLHRNSNSLNIKVKPLPPAARNAIVGNFKLSATASRVDVPLGETAQVRVVLEGKGNFKNVSVPKLQVPAGLKSYDPTTTDKVSSTKGTYGGQRTMEYIVAPQQTGTFEIPPVHIPVFDPESGKLDDLTTQPIQINVTPNVNVATAGSNALPGDPIAKNKLEAGKLKPIRTRGALYGSIDGVRRHRLYWPVFGTPFALGLGLALLGGLQRARGVSTEDLQKTLRKRARTYLQKAEKNLGSRDAQVFYAELEKGVLMHLESKLKTSVLGLTRAQVDQKLNEAGVIPAQRDNMRKALEACDFGRYAPGAETIANRKQVYEQVVSALQNLEAA